MINTQVIQQSYTAASTNGRRLAERFYDLLLEDFPSSGDWSPTLDRPTKETLFLSMLQVTAKNLHKPRPLAKYLEHLGRKYLSKSAEGSLLGNYQAVGKTLIKVLEEELAETWDHELAEQWVRTFNFAASAIKKGASERVAEKIQTQFSPKACIEVKINLDDEFRADLEKEIRRVVKQAFSTEIKDAVRTEIQKIAAAPSYSR